MPRLNLAASDFSALLLRLLPTGPVWSRNPVGVLAQVAAGLAPTWQRLNDRANYLVTDAFPPSTVELLPEWEATLGLPDPCAGADQTVWQRQAQVVARLIESNGPSIPSLTAFAAALGYPITITEQSPTYFGVNGFGEPYGGADWAFAWVINAPATEQLFAEYGETYFGEPYSTWGSEVLECEMNRLKPAHTILIFSYSGPAAAAVWGVGVWGRNTWA